MFRKQNYMQLVACVSKRETGGKCVSSSNCVQVIACLPKREARGQMCVKQHLLAYGCLHVKKGNTGQMYWLRVRQEFRSECVGTIITRKWLLACPKGVFRGRCVGSKLDAPNSKLRTKNKAIFRPKNWLHDPVPPQLLHSLARQVARSS